MESNSALLTNLQKLLDQSSQITTECPIGDLTKHTGIMEDITLQSKKFIYLFCFGVQEVDILASIFKASARGPMLSISQNVRLSVRLSVCLSVHF